MQLLLKVKRVVVKLEGGVGRRTVPLVITELAFHSEVSRCTTLRHTRTRACTVTHMCVKVSCSMYT